MAKLKISVVTATRAEYGLLYPVMRLIEDDSALDLQLIVTGTHLDDAYGRTVREIEKDGFSFFVTDPMPQSSGSARDVVNIFSAASQEAGKVLETLRPDLLLLLGDRYEMLAFAASAFLMNIPVAHIGGGEMTSGALDDSIRHAITKLSSLHFPMTEAYGQRIRQMGEPADSVVVVGSTGVENALSQPLLDKGAFEAAAGYRFADKNLLATFHPVTTDPGSSKDQLDALLTALDTRPDIKVLFTMPNADEGGLALGQQIKSWCAARQARAFFVESLGFRNYLSALQFMDGVIGNSSSGIIEAPSFRIGTINIGSRQNGRIRADSIIDCPPVASAVGSSIDQLYSPAFQAMLQNVENPFYRENCSEVICRMLKERGAELTVLKLFSDLKAGQA